MTVPLPADLAVVLVNYNAGDYLARCVTSVVDAAGGLALDVLVVDNASHDGSARVAAARPPQLRLIENRTNRGLSAAWNQGARAVNAPWILLLNPDAEIVRGDLGGFLKVGERRPDVALLGPVIRNPDGTIYESGRGFPGVLEALGHAFLGPFAWAALRARAELVAVRERVVARRVRDGDLGLFKALVGP